MALQLALSELNFPPFLIIMLNPNIPPQATRIDLGTYTYFCQQSYIHNDQELLHGWFIKLQVSTEFSLLYN